MDDEIRTEEAPPPSHVCVVYDPSDGRVVHTHGFIGESFDPDECAQMALDTVKSLGIVKSDSDGLKVLHAPRGFELLPQAQLHVDLNSNELLSSEPRHPFADAIERARAGGKRKI
jgi:hypothetical protein